jgi:superfamily II DNA or RNA helicase
VSTYTAEPHQREALDAISAAFISGLPRAQVHMACGTGKTLVGFWAAGRLDVRLAAVMTPSLALIAQTVRAWREAGDWSFDAILVCSDYTTEAASRERVDGAPNDDWWTGQGARVTTNAAAVADAINRPRKRPLVIFSTYHSAPVVAEALRLTGRVLDLVVADEAHHLAGLPRKDFRAVIDGSIPATATLFMTASPVTRHPDPAAATMSDRQTFGPIVYKLGFADAIERGLLTDYRVIVYEATSREADYLSAFLSGVSGDTSISRVLTFHGRVRKAQAFAGTIDRHVMPDGRSIRATAVAGTDKTRVREQNLAILDQAGPDVVASVSSARCLSEGVDLPAVDAVLFADPRTSEVSIVQAIGRVLRRSPGKTRGTVLVPIVVPEFLGGDADIAGHVSPFRHVWRVLQALRSVDPTLQAELDDLASGTLRVNGGGRHRVEFRVPTLGNVKALLPREADTRRVGWDQRLEQLRTWAVQHDGDTLVAKSSALGMWVASQRQQYAYGVLEPGRVASLEQVPGWVWSPREHRWLANFAAVTDLAGRGLLDLDDAEFTERAIKREPAKIGQRQARTLGQWCAQQRVERRFGEIDAEHERLLSQVPGWRWDVLDEADADAVDLLAEYTAWKRDANAPEGYVEDGIDLGAWLRDVRRTKALGRLPQPLLDEISYAVSAAPADGKLRWFRGASLWRVGLQALRQFRDREGHLRVPDQWVEELSDTQVLLSVWCRNQRREQRHGRLHPRLTEILSAEEGWRWEIQPAPRVRMDIGDERHGTRTGYVKGCRCTPCTEANVEYNQGREAARQAGEATTDLVPAAPARGKLLVLNGRGASRNAMSRALDLNPKTIDEIMGGERKRVTPQVMQVILDLTMDDIVRVDADMLGLRIDGAPTWVLLDDLIGRGFPKSWIASELGVGKSLQMSRNLVTRANAQKVAALHERVGTLRAPRAQRGVPCPPLDALLDDAVLGAAAAA